MDNNILDNNTKSVQESAEQPHEEKAPLPEYYTRKEEYQKNPGGASTKLYSKNGKEYIKRKMQNKQYVYSGSFICGDFEIKIHNKGNLLTSDKDNLVARIRVQNNENILTTFTKTKEHFFKILEVVQVFKDELMEKKNEEFSNFMALMQQKSKNTATDLVCAEDLYQIRLILENNGCFQKQTNTNILQDISNNKYISPEIKENCNELLKIEIEIVSRNKNLPKFSPTAQIDHYYFKEFTQICIEALDSHKTSLKSWFSISQMDKIPPTKLLFLGENDVNLFSNLCDADTKKQFTPFLNHLQELLCDYVIQLSHQISLKSVCPLTHQLYLYLFKSFLEITNEISIKTKQSISELLCVDQGKWRLAEKINWPSQSPANNSLEQQYKCIFQLMKHFAPGANFMKEKFDYKFNLLPISMDQDSWKKTFINWIRNSDTSRENSEECLVWMYILDNAVYSLFSTKKIKKLFKNVTLGYMNFIRKSETKSSESIRVGTHNIIRFIAQTVEKVNSSRTKNILEEQIESILKSFSNNTSDDFRKLVDVYLIYWEKTEQIIEKIVDKFPYGPYRQHMEKMQQELFNISSNVMEMEADSEKLIKFFMSFNDFLNDLCAVEFNWFVKDCLPSEEVKLVNEEKKTYEIVNPAKYISLRGERPPHYIIEIISELINIVIKLQQDKKWDNNKTVDATSNLLSAIRKSICYLKDQPNYVSFDLFKKESTEPFACIVENCIPYDDFQKRINTLGESFWYLRKQDEIDIDKAVELYNKVNENKIEKSLIDSYNKYIDKFTNVIEETIDKEFENKIEYVIEKIKQTLKLTDTSEHITISDIRLKLKVEILPELLAELSALWSIQLSKDIASTGKSFKPHCIQILCILRLLSVDTNSDGIDKHLAQVLTGQGKSLVLGLLSALLALLGCKVRVVCYSKYLATRDHQDFTNFFMDIGVKENITYSTFKELANEVMCPKVNGKEQSLRELVENLILNYKDNLTGIIEVDDVSNTVLLIDEVDVFFTEEFYGNVYSACTTPKITSLYNVQEKIWEMVNMKYDHNTIFKEIDKKDEFYKPKFATAKYNLLKTADKIVVKNEYTTASLYQEELNLMIANAIAVANGTEKDWFINKYKLNDEGMISYRTNSGEYSTHTVSSYYNIFNYLRLSSKPYKKSQYGYLNVGCGEVSYAKLPEKYPLILGVSGTLSTLDDYEKQAVREYYSINKSSLMPSFFGDSHLQFCTSDNVHVQDNEEQWLKKIYNHTNSRIESGQSILIFFNTDIEINKFYEKYRANCDRLNILTENTKKEDKKKYIEDAGISKTITIATRGMGRGIDFKSSVTVEKNGGVHVIQTFFSLDIKEETQIKGRTARKDNKGSYELILCKEHLIAAKFLNNNAEDISYDNLSMTRLELVNEKGLEIDKKIKDAEENHRTTMDYFESFFFKDQTN